MSEKLALIGTEAQARVWFETRVSRGTYADMEALAELTQKWQRSINLVANSTLPNFWQRHLIDSAQLDNLVAQERSVWIDLGSGGGFPGLVIALLRREHPGFAMHLVESNGKKCAFLREAARQLRLPVTVHMQRIEIAAPDLCARSEPASMVVSARALASLSTILEWCHPALQNGAIGLFPKGQDVDDELVAARKTWNFGCDLIQSISQERARIVRINHFVGSVAL